MNKVWQMVGRIGFWLVWPALYIYLYNTQRTRVIITAGDKVLLVKGWLSAGQWMLPGGGLRQGERPEIGLVREVQEECGLILEGITLKKMAVERGGNVGLTSMLHFYSAKLPAIMPVHRQRGEITAAVWLPLSELSKVTCASEVHRALQLLAEQG